MSLFLETTSDGHYCSDCVLAQHTSSLRNILDECSAKTELCPWCNSMLNVGRLFCKYGYIQIPLTASTCWSHLSPSHWRLEEKCRKWCVMCLLFDLFGIKLWWSDSVSGEAIKLWCPLHEWINDKISNKCCACPSQTRLKQRLVWYIFTYVSSKILLWSSKQK